MLRFAIIFFCFCGLRCHSQDQSEHQSHSCSTNPSDFTAWKLIESLITPSRKFLSEYAGRRLPDGIQVAEKNSIFLLFRIDSKCNAIVFQNNIAIDELIESVKIENNFHGTVKPGSDGAYDFAWSERINNIVYLVRIRVDSNFVYRFEVPEECCIYQLLRMNNLILLLSKEVK